MAKMTMVVHICDDPEHRHDDATPWYACVIEQLNKELAAKITLTKAEHLRLERIAGTLWHQDRVWLLELVARLVAGARPT